MAQRAYRSDTAVTPMLGMDEYLNCEEGWNYYVKTRGVSNGNALYGEARYLYYLDKYGKARADRACPRRAVDRKNAPIKEGPGMKSDRIRIEAWNGHSIRFIEREPGDWWAIAKDVAEALEYARPNDAVAQHCKYTVNHRINTGKRGTPLVNIIPRKDIFRLVFRSEQPDAEAFQEWAFDILDKLREASGLESYQIFRMMDKDFQKEAMAKLHSNLHEPKRVDFIKCNTVANKAVSTMFGHPKMLKKDQMTPEMLKARQPVLADAVNLSIVKESFGMDISVSGAVYGKYLGEKRGVS